MPNTSLLNNQALTADSAVEGPIAGNGTHLLYVSPKQNVQTSINAAEIVIEFADALPEPGQVVTNYQFTVVVETEDSEGNWHPIHSMYEAYRPDGLQEKQTHLLEMGPHILNFDGASPVDTVLGNDVISREHRRQLVLPDDFRVCVYVTEKRFGDVGAFDSVRCTLSYNTFAV